MDSGYDFDCEKFVSQLHAARDYRILLIRFLTRVCSNYLLIKPYDNRVKVRESVLVIFGGS